MGYKLKSSQAFESHLMSVFGDLSDASRHFYFLSILGQALSDYEREMNCSLAFWYYTIHAHESAGMSSLCRVYDRYEGAVHLRFLLETVRNNLNVFLGEARKQRLAQRGIVGDLLKHYGDPDLAQIDADIKLCLNTDPHVNKLHKWRDEFISHKNKRVSMDLESFKKQWPLMKADIEELITRANNILNRCGEWYDARFFPLELPKPQDKDYEFVLEALRVKLSALENNPVSRALSESLKGAWKLRCRS
jgi:hypothetical protein